MSRIRHKCECEIMKERVRVCVCNVGTDKGRSVHTLFSYICVPFGRSVFYLHLAFYRATILPEVDETQLWRPLSRLIITL